jgi:transcriptional regulator with XRE-family HTH domain
VPTFSERLKQLRQARGLTQEGLARAAGVTTSAISKLEQLQIDPSWSTVQQLATALGVSVAAFAEDNGDAAATAKPAKRKRGK